MMTNLQPWWNGRTPREQRLLAIMIALFAIVIVWLGIIRPLGAARDEAETRHARAVVALAQVRELGGRAEAQRNRVTLPVDEALAPFLTRNAAEAGLTVERLEAEGAYQTRLNIAAVRPTAFFGWAQRLEVRHGLIVEQVAAFRNADATIAVQATIRRPER